MEVLKQLLVGEDDGGVPQTSIIKGEIGSGTGAVKFFYVLATEGCCLPCISVTRIKAVNLWGGCLPWVNGVLHTVRVGLTFESIDNCLHSLGLVVLGFKFKFHGLRLDHSKAGFGAELVKDLPGVDATCIGLKS